MTSLGFDTLAGNVRVRTPNGLVRLDQLGGDTDLSAYYTSQQVDTRLLFKQTVISSTSGTGTEVWDSTANMVRRLVAGTGVTLSVDANGNIVVDSTGSSSGIPSSIATFASSGITHLVPTTCSEVNTGTIRSNYYLGNGSPDVSLLGTNSASVACTDTLGVSSVASRCRSGQEGA